MAWRHLLVALAGVALVAGAAAQRRGGYPWNQDQRTRPSPTGRPQFGGQYQNQSRWGPTWPAQGQRRFGQPTPAIPGVGGGLPTIPLRTPGTGAEALLPFLGGRIPDQGQRKGPDLSRWPSWVQVSGPGHRAAGLDAAAQPKASHCLLLRLSDGVEVRPAGEEAFYPLAFWDSTRVLEPGASVRVRGQGRAQLVFAAGTTLDLLRHADVTFVQGTKQRLVVAIEAVTRGSCRLGIREVELRLPDGSRARGKELQLLLERASRPAPWAAAGSQDRLFVSNWGAGKLALEPAPFAPGASAKELGPNRRSVLALVPRENAAERSEQSALTQRLPGGGVAVRANVEARFEKHGEGLRVQAGTAAAVVEWGGFRCRLPAGRRMTLDPLAGRPFGQARASKPAESTQPGKEAVR